MNRFFDFFLRSDRTSRVIDRRAHATLDYLTVAYFLLLAGRYWGSHRRAATTALANAGAVLGASMFTDYPGALRRLIPFETHGKIDIAQAGMAAVMPAMLGFADDAEAIPFYLQTMNEIAVIMLTDWQGRESTSGEALEDVERTGTY